MVKGKKILIMFYRGPYGGKKEIPIPKNYIETSYQVLKDMFDEYKEEEVNTLSAILPSTCSFGDSDFFSSDMPFTTSYRIDEKIYTHTINIDMSHLPFLDTISGYFGAYYYEVKRLKIDFDKIILLSIANEEDTKKYVDTICQNEDIPKEKVTAYLYREEAK